MSESISERLIAYEAMKMNLKIKIGNLPEKKQFHPDIILNEADNILLSGIGNAMSIFFRVNSMVCDLEKDEKKK